MNDLALIKLDVPSTVEFPTELIAKRESLLDLSAAIGVVDSKESNEACAEYAIQVHALRKQIEKLGVEARKPINELHAKIMDAVRDFTAPLVEEHTRLLNVSGEWVMTQDAKQRATQAKIAADLNALERETQSKISEAKSLEEVAAIRDDATVAAAVAIATTKPPGSALARGQVGKWVWRVTVTDIRALAGAMPDCVSIEPRSAVLKEKVEGLAGPAADGKTFTAPGVVGCCVFETSTRIPRGRRV